MQLEDAERAACPEILRMVLADGDSYRELFRAVALLASSPIDSHHTVYSLRAAHHVARATNPSERALPLVWLVDQCKRTQTDQWSPPRTPLGTPGLAVSPSSDAIVAAVESGDAVMIAHVIRTAIDQRGLDAAWQMVYEASSTDWAFIGHLMIAAVNLRDSLRTIGLARSGDLIEWFSVHLVRVTAFERAESDRERAMALYLQNSQLAGRHPDTLPDRRSDPSGTITVLDAIRSGEPGAASRAVADALTAGVSHRSVWNGIHLGAAELILRARWGWYAGRESLSGAPLHANTVATAFRDAYENSSDPRMRTLLMLQACGWVTELTRLLEQDEDARVFDILSFATEFPPGDTASSDDVFDFLPPRYFKQPLDDRSVLDRAAIAAFHCVDCPAAARAFKKAAMVHLLRRATVDAHDYKFPFAMFTEFRRTDRRWLPYLAAATTQFLHGPATPEAAWFTAWQHPRHTSR